MDGSKNFAMSSFCCPPFLLLFVLEFLGGTGQWFKCEAESMLLVSIAYSFMVIQLFFFSFSSLPPTIYNHYLAFSSAFCDFGRLRIYWSSKHVVVLPKILSSAPSPDKENSNFRLLVEHSNGVLPLPFYLLSDPFFFNTFSVQINKPTNTKNNGGPKCKWAQNMG